ncbi:MAG: hypothetical protein K2O12_01165 [Muribaculaceae bacterium]|nr:hypothetical protein [Muribaculaceae bacterium]
MKKICIIAVLCLFFANIVCEAKKDAGYGQSYEIEGAGTATQGDYLVTVSVVSKSKKVSDEELRRAAVHGVLFRGFSNTDRRQSQKPLAGSAADEARHIHFYSEFFGDNGTAANYAVLVPGSRAIKKSDKKYRVSATVTVHKESLLRHLESAGVVKGLNDAF